MLLTVDVASAGYLLYAPGFARILVAQDGIEVLCDPEPGSAEWSTLIHAQALPLAATLRGLEVLHASGVVLNDGTSAGRAALFAGPQGAGKSSLAAGLLRSGASLLSDDIVAMQTSDGMLIAHPGPDLLQLRPEEHDRLSAQERGTLGTARVVLGKQRFKPSQVAPPVPFGALFLLERSPGPPIEKIQAIDPFALLACTFNLSVRTPERLTRHLDLAVSLASTGHIYRLRIQSGIDATQLAEIVLQSLREI